MLLHAVARSLQVPKIATVGMAELFLAKQGWRASSVVAIKRILAHLAYDEEFINMFRTSSDVA
ncbi:MAG: hypothetical protein H6730_06145 [Deltaproteobacteria bacterium]|nr:hypothetical protein [Deltaproteobacteria bacterium]